VVPKFSKFYGLSNETSHEKIGRGLFVSLFTLQVYREKTIPTTNGRNKKSRSVVRIAKSGSNDYSEDCPQNKQNRTQMTIPTTVVKIDVTHCDIM
jgi:hypothetical protein